MKTSWNRILLRAALVFTILAPAAAMTPEIIARWLSVQATALPSGRTIDGNSGDWLSARSPVSGSAKLVSNGTDTEWAWSDKLGDARDGASGWWTEDKANWDIEQVRITGDATYMYVFVEVDWWAVGGDDRFEFNIAIDTEIAANPAGGTTGFNWIGDDANTLLTNAAQRAEINLALDKDGIYKCYDQSFVLPWAQIGSLGTDIAFNQAGGFLEARMKWSDLGFTTIPSRLRFTMASARRKDWGLSPQAGDKTEELPAAGGTSQMLDAITLGASHQTGDWTDELQDASIGYYVDVAFDATGNCVDNLPTRPGNIRVYDPVQRTWFTGGETILTNNPVLEWTGSTDADAGDAVVAYYLQIGTSDTVTSDGFFHAYSNGYLSPAISVNSSGAGSNNMVVYLYDTTARPWWGGADSTTTGIPNALDQLTPYLQMGMTYYIRVWARDRRGVLSLASNTCTMPIDYPVFHDPYAFGFSGSTFRGNRDPKENDPVIFRVGCLDPAPFDPHDNVYFDAVSGNSAPNNNEILNVMLHIRVNRAGHFTYQADWSNPARALLGTESEWGGTNRWYVPNDGHPLFGNATDPADTFTIWKTGGTVTQAYTPSVDFNFINLGNGVGTTYGLQSVPGDIIEYFFEINCPFEAPVSPSHSTWRQSAAPRRFLIARDDNGITGYKMGTWEEAKAHPFRFVVQKRDLTAVWHNPLSSEIPQAAGDTLTMRSPAWPNAAQTVKMYVGCVGTNTMNWQIVSRNVDGGAWSAVAFNGPTTSIDSLRYYYSHDFAYSGGMVEYYFKTADNSVYIFANGITNNADSVFENSVGVEGHETVPFRFPYTSRVKFTSTGATAKDSHSIVAVLGFKAPRFDAMNENAIGVNGVLDMRSCSATIDGNAFSNAFPGAEYTSNMRIDSPAPQSLIGRSYFAMLTNLATTITGIRRAFWGPIYPLDYVVSDSSRWNTGSDAYENVPILTYSEVFEAAVERTITGDHTFNAASDMKGVVYVTGTATISSVTLTEKCSIIADTITVSAGATVTGERLDLCALGGPLRIQGNLIIDTGILFSNSSIIVDPDVTIRIRKLGSAISQNMYFDTRSQVAITHPPTVSFAAAKESVLSRATRWVISSLRESRR